MSDWRTFPATITRVIDGDTVVARVESSLPGLTITAQVHVRLHGINAPETHGLSRLAGLESSAWLRDRLQDKRVTLHVHHEADKYGRWLGRIECGGTFVNDEMVKLGLAEVMA